MQDLHHVNKTNEYILLMDAPVRFSAHQWVGSEQVVPAYQRSIYYFPRDEGCDVLWAFYPPLGSWCPSELLRRFVVRRQVSFRFCDLTLDSQPLLLLDGEAFDRRDW
jgi:hypothetical protein